jgi:acyl-CoA synthetase (AMP-forming)/AMP-acid ligase II
MLLRKTKSFINTQFPYLRYVTQAGGKLHTIFIEEFRQAFPNIKFYVMYGQTEATARLSYLPPAELTSKLGSIGKGIPDVKLKVINDHGDEVKPGEVGEIVALGKNVMMGYFKDEQLTTETIRNGWLYTGDLATVDDDGYIFIYSRKKDFLKVGGKRISPKEIEEIILLMPEIVDCTVTGIEDELLGEAIKTKIVLNDESKKKITEQDILAHCQKHLALHKIPKYIEFDNTIAMSATGKKIKVGESTESP